STSRYANRRTYFPSTKRHAVSGPDRISPIGPHRNAQNAAATSCATSERPMLDPYSHGSKMLLQIASRARNRVSTASGWPQPPAQSGAVANENSTGGISPTHVPTYGMYRISVAMKPHRSA